MVKQKNLDLFAIRQRLDSLAEVGWNELKTTDFLVKTLGKRYLKKGVGKYPVGVLYQVGNGHNKIVLRADIDGLKFADGTFHACGHSTHMAGLVSSVIYARQQEKELSRQNKSILFVFQPAEETFPSGAGEVIKDWPELSNAKYIFGLHVDPNLKVGEIWCQPGVVMAWGDYFEIEVIGETKHIKYLSQGNDQVIDAIEGASIVIAEIKNFQSQLKGQAVINVGTIKGGLQPNSIAGQTLLCGDVRSGDQESLNKIKKFVTQELSHIVSQKYKGKLSIKYLDGYPAVINDTKLSHSIIESFRKKGKLKLSNIDSVFDFGVEDFSFYCQIAPLLYAKVGTGGGQLHTRDFQVPPKTLLVIEQYWSQIIDWWLSQ